MVGLDCYSLINLNIICSYKNGKSAMKLKSVTNNRGNYNRINAFGLSVIDTWGLKHSLLSKPRPHLLQLFN